MTQRPWFVLATLGALWLGACSAREDAGPVPAAERQAVPAAAAAPAASRPETPAADSAPAVGKTIGGDGSSISLSALSAGDLEDRPLVGELGCSFSTDAVSPLLLAMGYVDSADPAFGLVKVSGYVERIAAAGGFDAMVKGATFTGQGKTIVIALAGSPTGAGESPSQPATLTYQRADGASLTLPGRWACGP